MDEKENGVTIVNSGVIADDYVRRAGRPRKYGEVFSQIMDMIDETPDNGFAYVTLEPNDYRTHYNAANSMRQYAIDDGISGLRFGVREVDGRYVVAAMRVLPENGK